MPSTAVWIGAGMAGLATGSMAVAYLKGYVWVGIICSALIGVSALWFIVDLKDAMKESQHGS